MWWFTSTGCRAGEEGNSAAAKRSGNATKQRTWRSKPGGTAIWAGQQASRLAPAAKPTISSYPPSGQQPGGMRSVETGERTMPCSPS